MKSKTCTNWKIKDSDIVIEELKEKIIKYEEEKNVFTQSGRITEGNSLLNFRYLFFYKANFI